MKTIKKCTSLAALCIIVAVVAAGCRKADNRASLKLSLSQNEISVGEKVQFIVTSESIPDKDVIIDMESDNNNVAAVPASVTLKAGESKVSGEIEGLAEGSALITISSANAVITESSAKLNVIAPEPLVELSLSVSPEEVQVGKKAEITISTPVAPDTDLAVTVKSSDRQIVSVPEVLIIKAGEKTVTGEAVGASAGTAVISIESDGIKISSGSKEIAVKEPPTVQLTLTAQATTLYVGKKIELNVSTPTVPKTDIKLIISSSDPEIISPVRPEILLLAGHSSVKAQIEGKSHGTATISIVSDPAVDIIVGELELTCEQLIPEIYEVYSSNTVGPDNFWDNFRHAYSPYNVGGLWYSNELVWDGRYGIDIYKTVLDPYGGDFVGGYYNKVGVMKSVEYDTPIDENLNWIEYVNGSFPSFWTNDGYSIGNGELYVVCTLPSIGSGDPNNEYFRAWLKINADGPNIQVLDGAICVNDAVFRVGMKAIE